jgi:hypothetical protein
MAVMPGITNLGQALAGEDLSSDNFAIVGNQVVVKLDPIAGNTLVSTPAGLKVAAAVDDVVDVSGATLPIVFPIATIPGSPVFAPNTPAIVGKIYTFPNGQTAVWNGAAYASYVAPGRDYFSNVTTAANTLSPPDGIGDLTEAIRREGSLGFKTNPLTTVDNAGSHSLGYVYVLTNPATPYTVGPLDSTIAMNGSTDQTVTFPDAAAFPRRVVKVRLEWQLTNSRVLIVGIPNQLEHIGGSRHPSLSLDSRSVAAVTFQSVEGYWRILDWTERAYYPTTGYTVPASASTFQSTGGVSPAPNTPYQIPSTATSFAAFDGNYVGLVALPATNNATGRFSVYTANSANFPTPVSTLNTDLPQTTIVTFPQSLHFEWSGGLWRWVYAPEMPVAPAVVTVPIVADFFRSANGTLPPDGTTDYTEPVTHNGFLGVGISANPTKPFVVGGGTKQFLASEDRNLTIGDPGAILGEGHWTVGTFGSGDNGYIRFNAPNVSTGANKLAVELFCDGFSGFNGVNGSMFDIRTAATTGPATPTVSRIMVNGSGDILISEPSKPAFNASSGSAATVTVNGSIRVAGGAMVPTGGRQPGGLTFGASSTAGGSVDGAFDTDGGVTSIADNDVSIYCNGTRSASFTTANAFKPGGGLWGALSDLRTKRDVTLHTPNPLGVLSLNPIEFYYNGEGGTQDSGQRFVGFGAQPLLETDFAHWVTKSSMAIDGQVWNADTHAPEDQLYQVDSSNLVYELLGVVKSQAAAIDALTARLDALAPPAPPAATSARKK